MRSNAAGDFARLFVGDDGDGHQPPAGAGGRLPAVLMRRPRVLLRSPAAVARLVSSVSEALGLRAREVANLVGLAMLVLLMLVVFKNDVTRVMEKDRAAQQGR